MAPPPLVHDGQRFGRLVLVELETRRRRYRVYSCRCDCGGWTSVTTADLRHGRVTSCGCARVEAGHATGTEWGARNIAAVNAAR